MNKGISPSARGGLALLALCLPLSAQTLINVDFGAGAASAKRGLAATGQSTNDYWNLYSHYAPKFSAGMELVRDGRLAGLKTADGLETPVSLAVSNAPGVWGNATGDAMYDSYIYAQNGSNLVVTIRDLPEGQYHVYLYGHADPDGAPEQNSQFTLRHGTNALGPLAAVSSAGWTAAQPMQERHQYVVFRNLAVAAGQPVIIEVAPGPGGAAVLNGLQIISRGTSPPKTLAPAALAAASTNLNFLEIRYAGTVSEQEARFQVNLEIEAQTTNEISGLLFDGEVALLVPGLPAGVRLVSQNRQYHLCVATTGLYRLEFELLAKIAKAEPWNQISFTGPSAAIGSIKAEAASGVEIQMLSGTLLAGGEKSSAKVEALVDADRLVSLRWQSKAAEITRKSLVNVDTAFSAQITPTVVKYTTQFRCEILQAPLPKLVIEVPAGQNLIRLQGEQIRDWQTKIEGARQLLTVEFIKPVEKNYTLTLFSETPLESLTSTLRLAPAWPLDIQRETGAFSLFADDMIAEIQATDGLRQVNAIPNALATYRFSGRPAAAGVLLKRVEPVLKTRDRVTARLEETRLLVNHALQLTVEKAGLYGVEMTPPPGLAVAEVKGEGVEDWKVADGRLRVAFTNRLLGVGRLEVTLEQPLKTFPPQITIRPLRLARAANETAQVGAASALGIQLKTAPPTTGLREIPVSALSAPTDELLAFAAEQPDWSLTLAAERLTARVVAEIFNLVTIGDGLVGGSATVRYGLVNQGVQEFKVRLPAHWKNVEFTGANIRRKESQPGPGTNEVLWTITLQDKAWGGYTLVVTYDYQFDPKAAALDFAGLHSVGAERESGFVAITVAGNLKVEPRPPAAPLREIDPFDLSETDRAMVTRPIFRAYRYAGDAFALTGGVRRHEEVPVLDAVTDRTQITSVLTEAGEMLTQAGFMVKNNDRQLQRFQLPKGADFWAAYVNSQPVKAERDGQWLLVSLPRGANRDQVFAIDLVYAQKLGTLKRILPKRVELEAPRSDIPSTYAEWQIYVPNSEKATGFGGNMTVARGTTYGWQDAWRGFLAFYRSLGLGLIVAGLGVLLLTAGIASVVRRGLGGLAQIALALFIIGMLAAIAIPNFVKARSTSQRNSAINNLRQIAGAREQWALENKKTADSSLPSADDLFGADKYIKVPPPDINYIGTGKRMDNPRNIVAHSNPDDRGERSVLFANGEILTLNDQAFNQAIQNENHWTPPAQTAQAAPGNDFLVQRPSPPPPNAPPFAALQPLQGGGGNLGALPGGAVQTAAGGRPVRIELPRAGWILSFTKVLNLTQEPVTVKMTLTRLKVHATGRTIIQGLAFLAGLILVWRQWTRTDRSAFWLATGVGLVCGSVIALLITWRALHAALIAAPLILGFLVAAWLLRKIWTGLAGRKTPPGAGTDGAVPPPVIPPGSPVATVLVATLLLVNLAAQAGQAPPPLASPTNAVTLVAADYRGTVLEKVAVLDLDLLVNSVASNQTVRLFGEEVAVQQFQATNALALQRRGGAVYLSVAQPLQARAQMRIAVKLGGDIAKRQLVFQIPSALASKLSLAIEEADADVEFPSAVAFKRVTDQKQTKVEAVLGAGGRVEILWTPRVKRATEVAAAVFAQSTALAAFGGGAVNTRTTTDFQVTQGELRQVKIRLPAGERLLRVEGELIRVWDLAEEAAGPVLTVELVKPATKEYQLTVETERLLDKLPSPIQVKVPQPLEVIRATGLVGLKGAEELALRVESAENLQRVDLAEFQRVSSEKAGELLAAYRYLRPDFNLAAIAEPVQPHIEAVAMNTTLIDYNAVNLTAQIDYQIKKAGVFTLRLGLPEGYKVNTVAGKELQSWTERGNPRVLEVALKARTQGDYALRVALSQSHKDLPKTVEIAGVLPLDSHKLTGYFGAHSPAGISLKTAAFDGLTEVPLASLPSGMGLGAGALGFKYMPGEARAAAPWRLTVGTEAMESWIRAEVVNLVSVSETLLAGRSIVRLEVANAPVNEFRLKVPAAYTNVEITGPNIRRRDRNGEEWRVELQNKTRGLYTLAVNWEQPRSAADPRLLVTGVEALGVERETGATVLLARPPLVVNERSASDQLLRIDHRELPDWAGVAAAPAPGAERPVLVYRYLRPGWTLAAEVKRYEEAAVLQALVDSAKLTTVIDDDGQMMTEMTLAIRNNGRQHLEVELPAGAKVWSAFVAGQPVRPGLRAGKLLLPLERSINEAPVSVELVFVGAWSFPAARGDVGLLSPKLDLPLKNARWEVFLPPDYAYSDFGGSMIREAAESPLVQVFSQGAYQFQEEQKIAAKKAVTLSNLRSLRESIVGGKSSGGYAGNEGFNYVRNAEALGDEESVKELKQLQKDLRRAQSSNLIQGQRAYVLDNAAKLGDVNLQQRLNGMAQQKPAGPQADRQEAQPQALQTDLDFAVAEQQWERLEKAQEVRVAKVQPLRANLPTRGQRHVFTQILQTEINKPLTITFSAASTRQTNWLAWGLGLAGGFLGLWILAALLPSRQKQS